jgi:hypothetical protein
LTCHRCGFSNFRLSRFRAADLKRLLLLQYPVRCRSCNDRTYGGLALALALYQARLVRRAEREERDGRMRRQ